MGGTAEEGVYVIVLKDSSWPLVYLGVYTAFIPIVCTYEYTIIPLIGRYFINIAPQTQQFRVGVSVCGVDRDETCVRDVSNFSASLLHHASIPLPSCLS